MNLCECIKSIDKIDVTDRELIWSNLILFKIVKNLRRFLKTLKNSFKKCLA